MTSALTGMPDAASRAAAASSAARANSPSELSSADSSRADRSVPTTRSYSRPTATTGSSWRTASAGSSASSDRCDSICRASMVLVTGSDAGDLATAAHIFADPIRSPRPWATCACNSRRSSSPVRGGAYSADHRDSASARSGRRASDADAAATAADKANWYASGPLGRRSRMSRVREASSGTWASAGRPPAGWASMNFSASAKAPNERAWNAAAGRFVRIAQSSHSLRASSASSASSSWSAAAWRRAWNSPMSSSGTPSASSSQ